MYLLTFCSCVGYVFGGDVLRLYHGDECLTIPAHDVESPQRSVSDVCTVVVTRVVSNQRSYSTPGPVSNWMGAVR